MIAIVTILFLSLVLIGFIIFAMYGMWGEQLSSTSESTGKRIYEERYPDEEYFIHQHLDDVYGRDDW